MRRLVTDTLLDWSNSPRRKPLIVRGARQVGKTWAVTNFGADRFASVHVVDLERRRSWHRLFEGDLDAPRIVAELEVLLGKRIVAGSDLLFFDEIQACPRALVALRYFFEQLPELHVVAAASLLEFALGEFAFPVGRVQFMNVYPMTFAEFLVAMGDDVAAELVAAAPSAQSDVVHDHLLDRLRSYLFVGGMPEAVAAFVGSGSLQGAFSVHDELTAAYREDFGKYAGRADKDCLDGVLAGVARGVGNQVKYSRLVEGFDNRAIKRSFGLLSRAQVVRPIRAASPAGLPLAASASQKRFKAIMVDVGLMQRLCGLRADVEYARRDLLDVFRGALAEQFVGQELLAVSGGDPYYWAREERSSTAEVDYLIEVGGRVVPIEVKAGPSGRLRSLHMLLERYPSAAPGVVMSAAAYATLPLQQLVFVPLYWAAAVARGALTS
jgi:uncharacterized protein